MSKVSVELSSAKAVVVILLMVITFVVCLFVLNKIIRPHQGKHTYRMEEAADSLIFKEVPDSTGIREVKNNAVASGTTRTIAKSTLTFNQNPKLLIWVLLFSTVAAIGIGLVIPFSSIALSIRSKFDIPWIAVIGYGLILILLGVVISLTSGGKASGNIMSAFAIVEKFQILVCDVSPLMMFTRLSVVSGTIALGAILLINHAIGKCGESDSVDPALVAFLKESLATLLSAVSVMIMFAVMTTAMLQQAINAVLQVEHVDIFPSELVYIYGLMFTIFLAMLYLPVNFRLSSLEAKIPATSSDVVPDVPSRSSGVLKNLQPILSIFAPLLGSIFSEILNLLTT